MSTQNLKNKSPYELLFQKIPKFSKFHAFGCLCYPWLKPYNPTKLQPKSKPCVFIGYASLQNAYKCLDVSSGRVYVFKTC